MDPNIKGWLHKMCEKVEPGDRNLDNISLPGYEETLYRMVQPSGIMYGHPVKEIGRSGIIGMGSDPVSRMKLIYAESLIKTGSLSLENKYHAFNKEQVADHIIPEITDYFLHLYPGLYQGQQTSYLKNPYYLAEIIIGKRVTVKASLVKNLLANLYHNSLLFLDVYYFGEWIGALGSGSIDRIGNDKARMQLAILGIMALAAKADDKLKPEERGIFEFYLQSAGLTKTMEQEARSLLNNFGRLSDVDIPQVDSWMIRKYLLEMAMLVTLADREISESEHEFISKLGERLNFTDEEISKSTLAVESFVLDNWSAMHYLLGKHNLEKISSRFMMRLKLFVNRNKDYVVQEIRESKELFYLLGKSRTNTLTDLEKNIVNEQLIDIIKTIPTFVIIALPFTFITLPTLLALLPKKAFPSSFQE